MFSITHTVVTEPGIRNAKVITECKQHSYISGNMVFTSELVQLRTPIVRRRYTNSGHRDMVNGDLLSFLQDLSTDKTIGFGEYKECCITVMKEVPDSDSSEICQMALKEHNRIVELMKSIEAIRDDGSYM